jgi:glycosyltransferase involved in cell wall biosynthesis
VSVLRRTIYATSGWCIHDDRWFAALADNGLDPIAMSVTEDPAVLPEWARPFRSPEDLRHGIDELSASAQSTVLAGPLHSVTAHLLGLPIKLVGLSWGYDLSGLAAADADLAWLAKLDGLVVDSQANRAIADRAGLAPGRITFLPWGVDLATFAFHGPWTDAFHLRLPAHAQLVVSLRAHERIYRVGDIVEAFAKVPRRVELHADSPDPYLIIGHSGSLTRTLKQQVRDLGIADRTRFIGSVPERDLVPLLGRATCYVTASEVDGTSVTLLQAMACGTPVIASDTPGNLGWIADGDTGFTFPTGDIDALARLIDKVNHEYPSDTVLRARGLVEREADWRANLPRLKQAMELASASG